MSRREAPGEPMTRRVRIATLCVVVATTMVPGAASADENEVSIRSLRDAANKAIAAHDTAGSVAPMQSGIAIISSGGNFMAGRDAMARAFASRFAEPDFLNYERRPTTVVVSGDLAMEYGAWWGRWRNRTEQGCYIARWERTETWQIAAEMFVPAQDQKDCIDESAHAASGGPGDGDAVEGGRDDD